MLIIMSLNGSVCSFILIISMRGYKYGSHHGKRAERSGDHDAHHIAVIIFAGPDKAALRADHARNRIVDQGIEISDAGFLELGLIFGIKDLLEDVFKGVVILFGDGVLCREPEILLGGKREVKAGACKALDGIVLVVGAHQNAGALEIKDRLMEYFLALCILKEEFGSSGHL